MTQLMTYVNPQIQVLQSQKKYLVISLVALLPLLYFTIDNFLIHRRGFSSPALQLVSIFWIGRLLLAPLLAVYMATFWAEFNKIMTLIVTVAIGLLLYLVLHWSFSFFIVKVFLPHFDPRSWNLFNIIRNESTLTSLLIYFSSAGLLYAWVYFERYSERSQQEQPKKDRPIECITIKTGSKTTIISLGEILYLQSNGPYVQVVTKHAVLLASTPLYQLSNKLPDNFVRIHRSFVVNIRYIKQTKSLLNGDYMITLANNQEIRASRTYREQIRQFLVPS